MKKKELAIQKIDKTVELLTKNGDKKLEIEIFKVMQCPKNI